MKPKPLSETNFFIVPVIDFDFIYKIQTNVMFKKIDYVFAPHFFFVFQV